MLTQSNINETIIKQNEKMLITNNNNVSQLRYYNYYKYSGRYRSRMLRMNKNDRNYSNINNIPSIDENNEGNENNDSNDQALLSHKIDIYHKQLGPGRSLIQNNTNSKGGAMADDDIDSDRYSSWFLLTSYHYHNQSQPFTTLKALPSSSSSLYVPIQRRQSEFNYSPKMFLADYMQQSSNRPLSDRSPYNSSNNKSKIMAFSTLRKTMFKQSLIKKEFINNSINNDVYNNHLYNNSKEISNSNDYNNNRTNIQQNLPIQKEKIDFPQYLLKLQQSEKLPSVDILSLPERVVMSSELSINQINAQKEMKVNTVSLEEEEDV
jgi:hypothetical protein